MKTLSQLIIPLTVALMASTFAWQSAGAQVIEVSQESSPGAGNFDKHVLGYINVLDSAQTVANYYSYGTPFGASYNGPAPAAVDKVSYLFFHRYQPKSALSLVAVHDRPEDGSGGKAMVQVSLVGDPTSAEFLVKDDPTTADSYKKSLMGDVFLADNGWGTCCTDGFAIGYLDGGWTLMVEFMEAPSKIEKWRAWSATGTELPLALEVKRRVRMRPVKCPPASRVSYGKGWPGTLGVPDLLAGSDPVLGTTFPLVLQNSFGMPTIAVLLIGVKEVKLPTGLGGTLLVDPLISPVLSLPTAGVKLPAKVPNDPVLCGVSFYLQALQKDKGASHGVSFTPGLRLIVGT